MAVGGRFIPSAWVTLCLLRFVHQGDLPIELWYLDDNDFAPELRRLFERFDVSFVDARSITTASWLPRTGWELKPFALLHCRFAEVLLLDADNIPLIDPVMLFDEPRYASYGALVWPDIRPVNPFNPIWSIVGIKPPDGFEQETGQVVLDKRRHWAAIQLAEHISQHAHFYYHYVLGDKEAMHIALRMLKARFASPTAPAMRAEGHLPGEPADKRIPVGLWQHDFSGRRIFLHRTDVPLVAWGRNPEIAEFELTNAVERALSSLRETWDGQLPRPEGWGTLGRRTDSMPPGRFIYARRGMEQRIIDLLPNGRIGENPDKTEVFWELVKYGEDQTLTVSAREHLTCSLRLDGQGVWRGAWAAHEQTPVAMVAVENDPRPPQRVADARPSLLFISPVEPKDAGNGLAMRAANLLRSLVETHRVSLLIVPLYGTGASRTLPHWVSERCERVRWARRPSTGSAAALTADSEGLLQEAWIDEAKRCYWGEHFDVIHVFRLSSINFASPYLDIASNTTAQWHLDIDDVESQSGQRLATLFANRQRAEQANRAAHNAQVADKLEQHILQTWDRVYVCSDRDKRYLEQRAPQRRAEVVAVPNRVSLPINPASPPRRPPFTILYVGTLGYFPNADGAMWFCEQVIPAMRELSSARFRLLIVGTGAPPAVRSLALLPDVEVIGEVPVIDEWYERADIVVVPIRAGGGTRIKLLEAFAFRRPVVATHLAAEGLDVMDGEHLLLANRPIPFARACLSLMSDPALSERLARNGRALVEARYGLEPVLEVSAPAR